MADASSCPRISIVTPSFNQAAFVEQTLQSVLRQRYPNLEYIVMDGGSSDGTMAILDRYRDRLAHLAHGPDGGQAAAVARGLALCTGEIMAYLNSDDMLLPGALTFVADYFQRNPTVDLIYGHRCYVDEGNVVRGHWILPAHRDWLMRRWDLIPQETCFWRRTLWERGGNVDEAFQFALDYELFVRYMNAGRLRRVNRFLGVFRYHAASKTQTMLRTIGKREIAEVRRRHRIFGAGRALGKLLSVGVQLRSALFVRRAEARPGLPPGAGYNLTSVWGWEPAAAFACDRDPRTL
jgi:glycosyltransferase involved in cell wall biosynthesis